MKKFKKVTIVGVGLIGGSMGLAMKRGKLAERIVGVAKHKRSLAKAQRLGAIDKGLLNVKESVKGSDLVILATPIYSIIKIAKTIVKHLEKGCIVIDVGSTKKLIVKELEHILPRDIYFVGTHPLAGSEQRGIDSAQAKLFKHSVWIVTRTRKTNFISLVRIKSLLRTLGASVIVTSPNKHDKIVSQISHLPHILASSLVNSARRQYLSLAATGFKDITRIASSDSHIWKDICLTNGKEIVKAIDGFVFNLSTLKKLIKMGNSKGILRSFRRAKKKRDDYCH